MIKKRDQCKYQFDSHKLIDFSGADYLSDNDEFSMFFLDRLHRGRLVFRSKELDNRPFMLVVVK